MTGSWKTVDKLCKCQQTSTQIKNVNRQRQLSTISALNYVNRLLI